MPVSDDDQQLVRGLIALLREHQAGWIAAETEEAQTLRASPDYEADARMLLVAIAETVGLVPSVLLSARDALDVVPEPVEGVSLAGTEIIFDARTISELIELREHAEFLRLPVADLLDGDLGVA